MKIRSGFKQKRHRNKTVKAVLGYVQKKFKKLLTFNVFSLQFLSKIGKKKVNRPRKYLKRDILKKSFKNPYRKKRKLPSTVFGFITSRRYGIAQLVLVTTLFIWFIVLFVQPTFYISKITIQGNEEIPLDDLNSIIDEHLNKRNLFLIKRSHRLFLNTAKLEQSIRERYGLESIEFDSHWPSRSMLVTLKEKASVLAYSINDNYYTIDRQGMIVRKLDGFEYINANDVPVIYQYDLNIEPSIGEYILNSSNIETILTLHSQLQKYSSFSIHSYRLRNLQKSEVRIKNKHPEIENRTEEDKEFSNDLDNLAESIANAGSVEEKIATLKRTLEEIDIERIEDGGMNMIYDSEAVYTPSDDYQIQELEIYMNQGWSLKLGHELLADSSLVEKYLNIFATLAGEVDIEREVKEYVDLRFPNRIYYR